MEEEIGKPLSPYAITKYVNELYGDIFAKTYGMQCIGLRYFNVFGKRQDPNGAYAAVIPLWVKKLINHERPIINGDGSYSRDFTFIDNVIQANEKALFTSDEHFLEGQREYYNLELDEHKYLLQNDNLSFRRMPESSKVYNFSEVFNIAYGANTTLIQLFKALRDNLVKFDKKILKIEPIFGPYRVGDIPHSQASILKAKTILGYDPEYDAKQGFELAAKWYFENMS